MLLKYILRYNETFLYQSSETGVVSSPPTLTLSLNFLYLIIDIQQKPLLIPPSSLLTRRRGAGTAGLWQCGLTAAAPGQR